MAVLILVGGGSSSGKTTIVSSLMTKFNNLRVTSYSMDNYYKDLSSLSKKEISEYNFDHPDAIDTKRLYSDTQQLLNGEEFTIPEYDFITHKSTEGRLITKEIDIVIIEGIFALYFTQLLENAELKLFIDTRPDVRLIRRIRRDIKERNFTLDEILYQYENTVSTMHNMFVEPSKHNADIIIPGDRLFDKPIEMIEGYLVNKLIESVYQQRSGVR